MIAETIAVCVTLLALYAMRLYEARVIGASEAAALKRLATTAEVDSLRSEVETMKAEIKAVGGRVDGIMMRR